MQGLKPIQKKILAELALNSRVSEKELSNKLKVQRQLIHYHIKNLLDKGIISTRATLFFQRMGYLYYNVLLRVKDTHEIAVKISERFEEFEDVYWAGNVFGDYDILISFRSKNFENVSEKINVILSEFSEININYSIYEKPIIYKNNYAGIFRDKPETISLQNLKNIDFIELKNDYYIILEIIRKNTRISLREISREIKRSINYVSDAVKFLEKNIIRYYTIKFNFEKYNFLRYKIFIKFNAYDEKLEMIFFEYVLSRSKIVYADRIVGQYDVSFNLTLEKSIELNQEIEKLQRNFGKRIEKYSVLVLSKINKI